MILLGKVYEGLMVDLRVLNEKLVRRIEEMLVQLTACIVVKRVTHYTVPVEV